MKLLLLLISFLFINHVFAQETYSIPEGGSVEICGKTIRVDGIWVENSRIKADISILAQKNSKPVTGGYKMDDTIEIKKNCQYYVKLINKYGLNGSNGFIEVSNKVDLTDYLDMALTTIRLNEVFSIGKENWKLTGISKSTADFEITVKNAYVRTVTLTSSDIIWKGFDAYSISRLITEDYPSIEFKEVENYSYIPSISIPGEFMNAPNSDFPIGSEQLIIRKIKYYPKQKFVQSEYDNTPVKYWVLKVYDYPGGIARQMIQVERNGNKVMKEFDAYQSFDTEEEVLEFARVNDITDMKLEEEK